MYLALYPREVCYIYSIRRMTRTNLYPNRLRKPPEKLLAVFYLLCIGLVAALAAGKFRMDKAVLRGPALLLIGILVIVLLARWMRPQK
jgi:hypothetical protein